MKEVNSFRYHAKALDTGNYVIREGIGFEASPENNIIFGLYYDYFKGSVIKEPIYLASDEKDLRDTLASVAQFYANNPDDIVSFIDKE